MPYWTQEIEYAASFGWMGIVPVRPVFFCSGELKSQIPGIGVSINIIVNRSIYQLTNIEFRYKIVL